MRCWSRVLGLSMVCTLFLATGVIAAQKRPSGTLTLYATAVAAGVGWQWGDGTLTLNNGKKYRFSIRGLEVGGVGFSEVRAEGRVYNLDRVSDFDGLYAAAEASAAAGRGRGVRSMRNQHGVVINLSSQQKGVKLTLAGEGVRMALQE